MTLALTCSALSEQQPIECTTIEVADVMQRWSWGVMEFIRLTFCALLAVACIAAHNLHIELGNEFQQSQVKRGNTLS